MGKITQNRYTIIFNATDVNVISVYILIYTILRGFLVRFTMSVSQYSIGW
jgi:hypothetical protein